MLVPKGTPRPALTCLIVVIDLHLGWLQALHRDVPLHGEGKAQGLVVQLGKGSSGGLGVPLHLPWSLLVSPHWPHSTSALPATSALGLGGVYRTTGLADGQGETLGPFPTLRELVAGGQVWADLCAGTERKPAEGWDGRVIHARDTRRLANRFVFHGYKT